MARLLHLPRGYEPIQKGEEIQGKHRHLVLRDHSASLLTSLGVTLRVETEIAA